MPYWSQHPQVCRLISLLSADTMVWLYMLYSTIDTGIVSMNENIDSHFIIIFIKYLILLVTGSNQPCHWVTYFLSHDQLPCLTIVTLPSQLADTPSMLCTIRLVMIGFGDSPLLHLHLPWPCQSTPLLYQTYYTNTTPDPTALSSTPLSIAYFLSLCCLLDSLTFVYWCFSCILMSILFYLFWTYTRVSISWLYPCN